MRIGLISMSGLRLKNKELADLGVTLPQFVNRGKVIASLPSLGLLTVAALTPKDIEVVYREVNEDPDAVPLERFDLVGISSFTARIDDAYALADRYRELGVPVVLGGLHVSLLPGEASQHADAVVTGGAEGAWPQLIEDFQRGRLQKHYAGLQRGVFEPGNYVKPRFDLLTGNQYNRMTVQTSRGCPLNCEFCAASLRITKSFQQKPVALAIDEIKTAKDLHGNSFFELADDNSFVNKKWAKAFLQELRRVSIRWFTETDISVADDDELLDLLADSGCKQVLVGLESPVPDALDGLDPTNWKQKRSENYLQSIEKIQSRGISVNGCFVVGLDGHGPEIFELTKNFIEDSGLLEAQVTVPTPFPGTPFYHRLRAEGRLLRERYWDRCTLFDVNFRPKKMSVAELEQGLTWIFKEVYSERQLQKRRRHHIEIAKKLIPETDLHREIA